MNSVIIVESYNDKFFIEKLRDILKLENIELKEPICNITDYECLGGLSETKLIQTLREVKFDQYQKIGIIIDADSEGIENRIALINKCIKILKDIPADFEITQINEFKRIESLDIEIGCYIMNVTGNGELETVLKAIKSQDSAYADCLEAWKACLITKGKPEISQKDFDKFWVSNYLRFDTCSKKEQKQANKNCKNEVAIKKDIWDFENPILNDLKEFLKILSK
jgi:hypothetical protein